MTAPWQLMNLLRIVVAAPFRALWAVCTCAASAVLVAERAVWRCYWRIRFGEEYGA